LDFEEKEERLRRGKKKNWTRTLQMYDYQKKEQRLNRRIPLRAGDKQTLKKEVCGERTF